MAAKLLTPKRVTGWALTKLRDEEREEVLRSLEDLRTAEFRRNFAAALRRRGAELRAEDVRLRARKDPKAEHVAMDVAVGYDRSQYHVIGVGDDAAAFATVSARLVAKHVRALGVQLAELRTAPRPRWLPKHLPLLGVALAQRVDRDAAVLAWRLGFIVLQLNGAEIYDHSPKGFQLKKY